MKRHALARRGLLTIALSLVATAATMLAVPTAEATDPSVIVFSNRYFNGGTGATPCFGPNADAWAAPVVQVPCSTEASRWKWTSGGYLLSLAGAGTRCLDVADGLVRSRQPLVVGQCNHTFVYDSTAKTLKIVVPGKPDPNLCVTGYASRDEHNQYANYLFSCDPAATNQALVSSGAGIFPSFPSVQVESVGPKRLSFAVTEHGIPTDNPTFVNWTLYGPLPLSGGGCPTQTSTDWTAHVVTSGVAKLVGSALFGYLSWGDADVSLGWDAAFPPGCYSLGTYTVATPLRSGGSFAPGRAVAYVP